MWLVILVSSSLLGMLLLLSIPLDLSFRIERDGEFRSRFALRWLFGLVGTDLDSPRKQPGAKRGPAAADKKPSKRKRRLGSVLAVLRSKGFLARALVFVRQVVSTASLEKITLELRLGLADPAETGFAFALICPLVVFLGGYPRFRLVAEPDFDEEKLELDCQGQIRVFPVRLAGIIIAFLLSPATLRALKAAVVARR